MNNNYSVGNIQPEWNDGMAQTLTFIVTEDCNLRCKYCYVTHKSKNKVMKLETAIKFIDYILEDTKFIKSEAVILDFIGGEPLLEASLIDQICDYFKTKTLDFRKIYQPDIREECKKAVYMNLQYEAIGTVQGELTIMRIFSEYLQKEYSKIKSCSEIDREVLEEFLIHLSTKDTSHSANSSYVISLRRQLETIGKIYSYERLEHLFINTDIPPEVNAEFRVYSDDEMKRLNAEITQMDVQIARCLLIHQMLGTRISDTLTLRPDCLTRENGQDMIEIYQVKTKRYKKPISKELAKLLQSSIEYTQEKFGDTEYIFVNEKEPDRPMQYMAIKTKVMSMIQEKQLKDDHGELFGFGTHMFRHYYGVKLTEMHLDDWTIARLLGHKRLNNVQHYRKMSNQRMADETREVRQMMSDIIYMSLAGWGEEYEQIRQDD